MEKQKATQEQLELLSCSTIDEQLPIKFESTGFTLTNISGGCVQCKKEILPEYFRGRVNKSFLPKVVTIDAVGLCLHCKLLTPFVHRVYEDYRFTQLQNDGWKEYYLKKEKTSLLKKILKFLF